MNYEYSRRLLTMRKNFGPQSWLFPMPVLIIGTYGKEKVKSPILCQVDFFAGK